MSVFDHSILYLRSPGGEVENVAAIRDAGFGGLAWNEHDHPVKNGEWSTILHRARNLGFPVMPWMYVNSDKDVEHVCLVGREEGDGCAVINPERPLADGRVSLDAIITHTRDMDAALSCEPWPFNSIQWHLVKRLMIHIGLFPQENPKIGGAHRSARDVRAEWYRRGVERTAFMVGMHDLSTASFPPVVNGTAVYTGNDVAPKWQLWGPHAHPKLAEAAFPYKGPGYGPNSPNTRPQSKPSDAWRALKRALHNAGFGTFTAPDRHYNQNLADAMRRFQRSVGIANPSGDYGKGSWEALRSLQSVAQPLYDDPDNFPNPGYAVDEDARAWTRSVA